MTPRRLRSRRRRTEARVKVVVTVPTTHAEAVRRAIGDAGGGALGSYTHCSFTVRGVGRFRPGVGARPHVGHAGVDETVPEDRIEVIVSAEYLPDVIAAIRREHPYEEIALDVYPLLPLPVLGTKRRRAARRTGR